MDRVAAISTSVGCGSDPHPRTDWSRRSSREAKQIAQVGACHTHRRRMPADQDGRIAKAPPYISAATLLISPCR